MPFNRSIAQQRLFGDGAATHRHRRGSKFRLCHRRRWHSPTANYTKSYSDGRRRGIGIASASKLLTGWIAGAGWEYALADHWLIRFEYLFAAFPKMNAIGVITEPGAEPIRCTARPTLSCRSLALA